MELGGVSECGELFGCGYTCELLECIHTSKTVHTSHVLSERAQNISAEFVWVGGGEDDARDAFGALVLLDRKGDSGVRVDKNVLLGPGIGDGLAGLSVVSGAAGEVLLDAFEELGRDGVAAARGQLVHEVADELGVAAGFEIEQALEVGGYEDVHRGRDGFVEGAQAIVGAGGQKLGEDVVFVGGDDKARGGQAHQFREITCEDVAKVASWDAELDGVAYGDGTFAHELGVRGEVVDNLRHKTADVDGVCAGKNHVLAGQAHGHSVVAKDALDLGLNVVKVALHGAYLDVGAELGDHLQALDVRHTAFGVENCDADVIDVGKACERGLACIARGGGHNHDVLGVGGGCAADGAGDAGICGGAGGGAHHELRQHLQRDIFKRAGRTMVELEQPVVACKRGDRTHLRARKRGAIGSLHTVGYLGCAKIIKQRAQNQTRDGCKVHAAHGGKIQALLGHGICYIKPAIWRDALRNSFLTCNKVGAAARAVVKNGHLDSSGAGAVTPRKSWAVRESILAPAAQTCPKCHGLEKERRPPDASAKKRGLNMNIALLGMGVVGRGVDQIISTRTSEHAVTRILELPDRLSEARMTSDYDQILADKNIDVVVECMGGLEPAHTYIVAALEAGKHVVTSNKAVVAAHFAEFAQVAAEHGVSLFIEATTGGGIPWIASLIKARRIDAVESFAGIMNGTTNYIIDNMQRNGSEFDQVLVQAQELGYAERDPSADIDGIDVRNKTIISASAAFDVACTQEVPTTGIRTLTKADMDYLSTHGRSVKLLGHGLAKDGRYAVAVEPVAIPTTSLEANVPTNNNLCSLRGATIGELKFYGQGAGSLPTGNAIVQDVLDCAAGARPTYRFNANLTYDPTLFSATYWLRTSADASHLAALSAAEKGDASGWYVLSGLSAVSARALFEQVSACDPTAFIARVSEGALDD